jgi:hypothetical protein
VRAAADARVDEAEQARQSAADEHADMVAECRRARNLADARERDLGRVVRERDLAEAERDRARAGLEAAIARGDQAVRDLEAARAAAGRERIQILAARDASLDRADRLEAERDAALTHAAQPAAGSAPVIRVVTWDWRGQPDLAELARAVWEASRGRAVLRELVTGGDEVALVIADRPVTDEEAMTAMET